MKSSAIKENKVFRRLYHRGKSKAGASLVTYCMKNRRGETRVGITTSKKIGTAAERTAYGARQAEIFFRARKVMEERLAENEQKSLFYDMEMPLIYVLADMEKQLTALGVLSHEEHR